MIKKLQLLVKILCLEQPLQLNLLLVLGERKNLMQALKVIAKALVTIIYTITS